jgi:hypothetical protein
LTLGLIGGLVGSTTLAIGGGTGAGGGGRRAVDSASAFDNIPSGERRPKKERDTVEFGLR